MLTRRVAATLATLEAHASEKVRADMAPRYGIVTDQAIGVPMARMQAVAKALGRDHALAAALWETGVYEARMVACMIDDPAAVTPEQMDRWRADFDNWAIVDTVCFKLFDRVPHAFARVDAWATLNDEFGRRAAFALLACLALHGRGTDADLPRAPAADRGRRHRRAQLRQEGRQLGAARHRRQEEPAPAPRRPRARRPARRSPRTRPRAGSARTRSRPSPRPMVPDPLTPAAPPSPAPSAARPARSPRPAPPRGSPP